MDNMANGPRKRLHQGNDITCLLSKEDHDIFKTLMKNLESHLRKKLGLSLRIVEKLPNDHSHIFIVICPALTRKDYNIRHVVSQLKLAEHEYGRGILVIVEKRSSDDHRLLRTRELETDSSDIIKRFLIAVDLVYSDQELFPDARNISELDLLRENITNNMKIARHTWYYAWLILSIILISGCILRSQWKSKRPVKIKEQPKPIQPHVMKSNYTFCLTEVDGLVYGEVNKHLQCSERQIDDRESSEIQFLWTEDKCCVWLLDETVVENFMEMRTNIFNTLYSYCKDDESATAIEGSISRENVSNYTFCLHEIRGIMHEEYEEDPHSINQIDMRKDTTDISFVKEPSGDYRCCLWLVDDTGADNTMTKISVFSTLHNHCNNIQSALNTNELSEDDDTPEESSFPASYIHQTWEYITDAGESWRSWINEYIPSLPTM